MISHEEVTAAFIYDPETGIFANRITRSPNAMVGEVAGSLSIQGYNTIRFRGFLYRSCRLAWFYVKKEWPPVGFVIDHINGITSDDRFVNLRLATIAQNMQNSFGQNIGARPKGVMRNGSGWQAQIKVNGARLYLGTFKTIDEAAEVYRQACLELHGEFANV